MSRHPYPRFSLSPPLYPSIYPSIYPSLYPSLSLSSSLSHTFFALACKRSGADVRKREKGHPRPEKYSALGEAGLWTQLIDIGRSIWTSAYSRTQKFARSSLDARPPVVDIVTVGIEVGHRKLLPAAFRRSPSCNEVTNFRYPRPGRCAIRYVCPGLSVER